MVQEYGNDKAEKERRKVSDCLWLRYAKRVFTMRIELTALPIQRYFWVDIFFSSFFSFAVLTGLAYSIYTYKYKFQITKRAHSNLGIMTRFLKKNGKSLFDLLHGNLIFLVFSGLLNLSIINEYLVTISQSVGREKMTNKIIREFRHRDRGKLSQK